MAKQPPKNKKKYGTWAKNFGKSIMYGSKQILSETAPFATSTITNLPEQVRELRKDLRDLRSDKRKIVSFLLGEDENFSQFAKDAYKNAKDSLRTGKFIDEEREERLVNKAFGMDDMDADFDLGGDEDDFDTGDSSDFDDDSSSSDFGSVEMGPTKIINNTNNFTGPSNKVMAGVGAAVDRNTEMTARGFMALDKSNKEALSFTLALNEKFASQSIDRLETINNNITQVVSFNNESLSPFVQGSLKYYDDSLAVLNTISETLQSMAPKKKEEKDKNFDDNGYYDIFESDGFNLGEYAKRVARNAKSAINDSELSMITMLNNPMIASQFVANPLGFLISSGIGKVLPTSFKNQLATTDKNLKSFMPALFGKIAGLKGNDNPLLSLIGNLFGIEQNRSYDSYRLGAFERGAISYDGESKKALTEVIPSYLSKIAFTLDKIAANQGIKGFENADQVIYDWKSGEFTNASVLKADADREVKDTKLSGFSDVRNTIEKYMNTTYGWGNAKGEKVNKTFEDLIVSLVDRGNKFNVNDIGKENTDSDRIFKTFFNDKKFSKNELEMVQKMLRSLPDDIKFQLMGSALFSSRNALGSYYSANSDTAITGTKNLIRNRIMNPVNSSTSTEYFDNYYKIYKRSDITSDDNDEQYRMSNEDLKRYNKEYKTKFTKVSQVMKDIEKRRSSFKAGDVEKGMHDAGLNVLQSEYRKHVAESEKNGTTPQSFLEFSKSNYEKVKEAKQKYYDDSVKELRYGEKDEEETSQFQDIIRKPFDFIQSGLKKLDNAMYSIIFGTGEVDENGKEKSLFQAALDSISSMTDKVTKFFKDDVVTPFKKAIFGNNIMDTEWYKAAKGALSIKLFGDEDKEGNYKNGILSETINSAKTFFTNSKEAIKKEYDEWFKPELKKLTDTLSEYIFGPKDKQDEKAKDGKEKPLIDKILGTISKGISQWAALLYGENVDDSKAAGKAGAKFRGEFKKAIPKGIQGALGGAALGTISGLGGFGVLGSLFLPGGPIGGALVGGALGLLHQSELFKEFLYGKEEETTDSNGNKIKQRAGGLISRQTMDFFKKNKTTMVGGGLFGMLKVGLLGGGLGFGLIPGSVVSVMGPVIAGAAWGLFSKSKYMQEMLYGKDSGETDENGNKKKIGGLLNKEIFKKMKKALPRAAVGAIGAGLGSLVLGQMGIVGSTLAVGVMPAAIAGAALGFMTSSENFTKNFFGYTDENGEYHAGLLDKAKNFFAYRIFKPVELFISKEFFKTKKWFVKNIAYPIADALAPMKVAMTKVGDAIGTYVSNLFSEIGNNFKEIFTKMGKKLFNILDTLMKPITFLSKTLFKITTHTLRSVTEAATKPIVFLGALTSGVLKAQAYGSQVGEAKDRLKESMKSGTFGDFFGALDNFTGSIIDYKNTIGKDKYGGMLQEHEEYAKKRDAKFEEEMAAEEGALGERARKLKEEQEALKANNWGYTPEQLRKRKEQNAKAQKVLNVQEKMSNSKDPRDILAAEQMKLTAQIAQNTGLVAQNTSHDSFKDAVQDGVAEATGQTQNKSAAASDDNAGAHSRAKKDEAEKNKANENQEKQTALLEDIASWYNGKKEKVRSKNKFAGSIMDKIGSFFSFGGNILGILGSFGSMATSLIKIAGMASAVYAIYEFITGNRRDGSKNAKMTESAAAGRLTERAARRTTSFGVAAAKMAKRTWDNSEFLQNTGRKIGSGLVDLKNAASTGFRYGESKFASSKLGSKLDDFLYGKKSFAKNADGSVSFWQRQSKGIFKPKAPAPNKETIGIGARLIKNIEGVLTSGVFGTVFKKVGSVIKFFKSLISWVFKPEIIAKITEKVGARAIGSLNPLVVAGFATFDFVSGWSEASRLFDVAPEDCDYKMKLISSLVHTIFGLSGMFWVDAGLSLVSLGTIAASGNPIVKMLEAFGLSIVGFDHRKVIAKFIYKAVSSEEDGAKLDQNQAKLENEYKDYLKKNNLDSSSMSLEEYQSKVKGNGTLWEKYGSPLLKRLTGVELAPNDKYKSFADMIQSPIKSLAEWFNKSVQSIMDFNLIDFIKQDILGIDPEKGVFGTLREGARKVDEAVGGLWDKLKHSWFYTPGKSGAGDGGPNFGVTSLVKSTAKKLYNLAAKPGKGLEEDGFTGGGDIAPTEENFKVDSADSGIKYYWSQRDPGLREKPVFADDPSFGNFADVGCAPTSLAMIASMYNGTKIDPVDTAKLIEKDDLDYGGWFNNVHGIRSSYFDRAADKLGLASHVYDTTTDNTNSTKDAILNDLSQGKAMILGAKVPYETNKTPFTKAGHYVVMAGQDPKDFRRVFIYDPLGKSGAYNADDILDTVLSGGNESFIANFTNISSMNSDKTRTVNGITLLNLDRYGVSFKLETPSVDYEHLTDNAKAALDYIGKYFKSLTGRDLVCSSGYRTHNTQGGHATGNCFDVVDDRTHTTLEKNEGGVRDKVIKEAMRVGISVYDEYTYDSTYKTAGHLHMDATNWMHKSYNYKGKSKVNAKPKSILDLIGKIASNAASMFSSSIAGKKWTPDVEESAGTAGNNIPELGELNASHKQVYNYLKKQGYDDYAIAGIMGNIKQESNFSGKDHPEREEANGLTYGGLGLFQWNGARTAAMKKFAAERGMDYEDPAAQLAYFTHEVNSSEVYGSPSYMNGKSSAREAAKYFADNFERCGDPGNRVEYADQFYQAIVNGEFSGAGGRFKNFKPKIAGNTPKSTFVGGAGDLSRYSAEWAKKNRAAKIIAASGAQKKSANTNIGDLLKTLTPEELNELSISAMPRNISISSKNIATNEPKIYDLILAIKNLDSHAELGEIIKYLKVIADSKSEGSNKQPVVNKQTANNVINRAREGMNSKPFSADKMRELMRVNETSVYGRDNYDLAYRIASGGEFKKNM